MADRPTNRPTSVMAHWEVIFPIIDKVASLQIINKQNMRKRHHRNSIHRFYSDISYYKIIYFIELTYSADEFI